MTEQLKPCKYCYPNDKPYGETCLPHQVLLDRLTPSDIPEEVKREIQAEALEEVAEWCEQHSRSISEYGLRGRAAKLRKEVE